MWQPGGVGGGVITWEWWLGGMVAWRGGWGHVSLGVVGGVM